MFGTNRKKTSTWYGTVAGTLSAGCPQYFISGAQILKEAGWWALAKPLSPPFLDIDVKPPPTKRRAKRKPVASTSKSTVEAAFDMSDSANADDLSDGKSSHLAPRNPMQTANDLKRFPCQGLGPDADREKRAKMTDPIAPSPPLARVKLEFPQACDSDGLPWSSAKEESVDSWFSEMDLKPNEVLPQLLLKDEAEDYGNLDEIDIDPGSTSPVFPQSPRIDDLVMNIRDAKSGEEDRKPIIDTNMEDTFKEQEDRSNLAEQQSSTLNDSSDNDGNDELSSQQSLVPLTAYEEIQILRALTKMNDLTGGTPEARRLTRKLSVRQAKRMRNLPVFNLDSMVRSLVGGSTQAQNLVSNENREAFTDGYRILDRYQLNSNSVKVRSRQPVTFAARLIGSEENRFESIISPYTARILKPFIWRDYETKPLKLKLLEEIVAFHRNRSGEVSENDSCVETHPIDYCYVRPQHIPSVNSLCQEFFWPGIDLSECLQYPDFSCVALYRRVVVGFAFMVPDVKYSEAYISFVFTHPEWRRAGIASFMLYHLVQTCMGKDVTLHVSVTNPALLLYQKFGFKVEEFIVDFYDKYYPTDTNECKHAMFLRLSR